MQPMDKKIQKIGYQLGARFESYNKSSAKRHRYTKMIILRSIHQRQ
jgi:hypothetical protein